jgi:hypothetical protein
VRSVEKSKDKEMDKLITLAQDFPFSESDLIKLSGGQASVNIVEYSELKKYKDLDHPDLLDGGNKSLIILYQLKKDFGHWVCIFFRPDEQKLEFFDSLGYSVDKELKILKSATTNNFQKSSGQDYPYLSQLISDSRYDKNVIYNDVALQKNSKDISTCGRWVGTRICLKSVPIKAFQSLFVPETAGLQANRYHPDWYVTALTMFVK